MGHIGWHIIWRSLGGIMVNGVPREVPRQKPEGPQCVQQAAECKQIAEKRLDPKLATFLLIGFKTIY